MALCHPAGRSVAAPRGTDISPVLSNTLINDLYEEIKDLPVKLLLKQRVESRLPGRIVIQNRFNVGIIQNLRKKLNRIQQCSL
jgi:hypothetical protein